jgi:4'-phosphopantetheinyl transferase EntD
VLFAVAKAASKQCPLMIEDLLPCGVASVEMRHDDPLASLLPEESAQLGLAVESRAREFTTTRSCARRALTILGLPATPILRGPHREPLWPSGVVGSITHCEGYRAAVAARQSDILTVGIDAEIHDELPADVVEHVCKESEITWMFTAPKGIHWDRVLFSAKESVYKAWFPLTQRWLSFEDVVVTVDPAASTFYARLLVESPVIEGRTFTGFHGRFMVRKELVITVTAEPRTYSSDASLKEFTTAHPGQANPFVPCAS